MTWFKSDDKLHSHPKARRAGLEAMGLWVMSGTYSMDYRTDGFIPDWFVNSWPRGSKIAAGLVRAGLWTACQQDDEPGFRFHDWHDFQPSLDVLEQRDAERVQRDATKAQSGRLGAHRRWHADKPAADCPYCQEQMA